jgi:hypothetical protein
MCFLSKDTTPPSVQFLLCETKNQSDSAALRKGSLSQSKSLLDLAVNIARAVLPIIPSSHAEKHRRKDFYTIAIILLIMSYYPPGDG